MIHILGIRSVIFGHLLACFILVSGISMHAQSLYINYDETVPESDLIAYDLCILNPETKTPLPEKVVPEQKFLGYLSLLEIAPDAPYRETAFASGVRQVGSNTTWNSALIDPSSEAWQTFVLETLAPRIIERGFDGFFLDTAESVELLKINDPSKRADYEDGLRTLVSALRKKYPKAYIVINRGFSVLPDLYTQIDGVLAESLYRGYDYDKKEFYPLSDSDTQWLLDRLIPAKAAGLKVFITDFLPSNEPALAQSTVAHIEQHGFVPLISEPDLMGGIIAPRVIAPREWLALYGGLPMPGKRDFPEDTNTMVSFQVPLEYYGYEVSYHNPHELGTFPRTNANTRGIILDTSLTLTLEQQTEFVPWLIKEMKQGKQLLVCGSFPDLQPHLLKDLCTALEIQGSLQLLDGVESIEITYEDTKLMGYETPATLDRQSVLDIQAPEGAQRLLSLSAKDAQGKTIAFDPVFTYKWGGIALYPYLMRLSPERNPMLVLDTFGFIRSALGETSFPAPDVTTAQGARLYLSHIDGDALLNFSQIQPNTRSGVVVFERTIEHFGLPITVSIIESEINGDSVLYTPREDEDFYALAREIFASPWVEPASHTYSHPFYWSDEDRTSDNYATQNVNLRGSYHAKSVVYEREIKGSIDFINQHLVSADKRTPIILWSGNCRVPPEALKIVRENGFLNMNGGNTTISKRAPFQALISPKSVTWGGETQVYAPIQNENNYNNVLENNRFGGFVNAIQTFEMTETPYRLKPVNVYYHFYSADRFDAFTALRRVMEWCVRQPLHPVFASQYIRMVEDSIRTRIYRDSNSRFVWVNSGDAQTFRIRQSLGYPNLNKSEGILGYYDHNDQRYLHTDGRRRVVLQLQDTPPSTPYLAQARAQVSDVTMTPPTLAFTTRNLAREPMPVVWKGLSPESEWVWETSGKTEISPPHSQTLRTDVMGTLNLLAPSGTHTHRLTRRNE